METENGTDSEAVGNGPQDLGIVFGGSAGAGVEDCIDERSDRVKIRSQLLVVVDPHHPRPEQEHDPDQAVNSLFARLAHVEPGNFCDVGLLHGITDIFVFHCKVCIPFYHVSKAYDYFAGHRFRKKEDRVLFFLHGLFDFV